MSTRREMNTQPQQSIFRDQLITLGDLMAFKSELLQDIKSLIKQNTIEPGKKYLKSFEVRKLLNISPNTLTNLRVNGTLPYTKVGGVIYFSYDDIEKMIEQNKVVNRYHLP